MKDFYGLKGTKLNIAIAIIAGTDFALFGYGMSAPGSLHRERTRLTITRSGCHGRSSDLDFFP